MINFEDDYTINKDIEMNRVFNRIFWPVLYKIYHNSLIKSIPLYEEDSLEEFKKKFSIDYGYGKMFTHGNLGNYNKWEFLIRPKDQSYYLAPIEYIECDSGKKVLRISLSILRFNSVKGLEKLLLEKDLEPLFKKLDLGKIDVEFNITKIY